MTSLYYHKPVMLNECIAALNIHPDGVYVDATFGGGGHSLAILEKIKEGRLIAFDQDKDVAHGAEQIAHPSFSFYEANFMYMKKYLRLEGTKKINGVLADLGVSSHQINTPERGFSTRHDGPLDMRMDSCTSLTAADVVNTYSEAALGTILRNYGEIRNARKLARAIVEARKKNKIIRNSMLLEVMRPFAPHQIVFRYFAQVFQALRIEVNKEMEALEALVKQCEEVLDIKGRLVVMSYHSLEDRMIKRFMRYGTLGNEPEKDLHGNINLPFKEIHRKPMVPQEKEILENNRARSAKLRVAERI